MALYSKLLLLATALVASQAANAGAVITNGSTSLGVNNSAELNFFGNGPGGFMTYGVFRAGVGDAISPGCACEGWGVSTTYAGATTAGFANQSVGSGGLTGGVFSFTGTTATSSIGLSGAPLSVRHAFGPSFAADTFQVNVTITNTGTETASNLTYRRVMDWDVPPTTFDEYVTHSGVVANLVANGGAVKFASDNGFASGNPLIAAGSIFGGTVNTDFVGSGPGDHGSVFDFSFGDLAPGESRLFNIFYGSASSKGAALGHIANVGANVYSLGQNSGPSGIDPGTPATFFFAFGGVGGTETGLSEADPVLPFVIAEPGTGVISFVFDAPIPRRWFDPPFADGFTYELLGGAEFTEVGAPTMGFAGPFSISVGGVVVASLLPGENYLFGDDVTKFTLSGILPLLDTEAPGFSTAFPTFLDWDGTATSLIMSPTIVPGGPGGGGVVPEPATWAMMLIGFGAIGFSVRRRKVGLVSTNA